MSHIENIPKPTPYPYQLEGISWLKPKRLALLADEMGLGKSVQAIKAAEELGVEKIIIVCPAIARITWQREILKWSSYSPTSIQILKKRNEAPSPAARIYICGFDYADRNCDRLRHIQADLLIVDESHSLKSIEAKRTQAILGSKGIIRTVKQCWFLSGTPMPNAPHDLWTTLYTFGQTTLNYEAFMLKFCETYEFNGRRVPTGAKKKEFPALKQILDKIMLRRRVKEVLKDLPEVRIEEMPIEAELDDLTPELKEQFEKLANFLGGAQIKNANALEQLAMLEGTSGSISSLRRYCVMKKVKPVCDLILSELKLKAYEKIIVFAIHREAVEGVKKFLAPFGARSINGSTSPEERQKAIDAFQDPKSDCKAIVINIAAGGTNITLTEASEIVFLEQDYVPGNNAQAIARAKRIGQKNSVRVRIAALADSIDEGVQNILTRKMEGILGLFG